MSEEVAVQEQSAESAEPVDEFAEALALVEDVGEEATAEPPADEAKPDPDVASKDETEAIKETEKAEEKASDTEEESQIKIPDGEEEGPAKRGWAAVKQAEKRLREMRAEAKTEQGELAKLREQVQAQQQEMQQFWQLAQQDPTKALERMGLKFDDVAQRVLNDGEPSAEEQARRAAESHKSEIAELKERQEQLAKQVQAREHQRLVDDYKSSVSAVLKTEEFELLASYPDAENMVFAAASRYAVENDTVLSADAAADMIQSELRDSLKALSASKAVRKALGLSEPEPTEEPAQAQPAMKPKETKTLTNRLASEPSAPPPQDEDLDDWEMVQRAAKLVEPGAW